MSEEMRNREVIVLLAKIERQEAALKKLICWCAGFIGTHGVKELLDNLNQPAQESDCE